MRMADTEAIRQTACLQRHLATKLIYGDTRSDVGTGSSSRTGASEALLGHRRCITDARLRQVRRGPSRRGDGGLDRVLIVPGICRDFAARGDGERGLGLGPLVTTR